MIKKLILVSLCVLVASLAVPAKAQPIRDAFFVSFDEHGEATMGGGTGFNGGEWYYYPNTGWYNQWFYDGPLDPDRYKEIDLFMTIMPTVAGAQADVAINWSSDDYENGTGQPPIPPLTIGEEESWIVREIVFTGEVLLPEVISGTLTIPGYNPEWVSIDIRGKNIEIAYGVIVHECIPEPATVCLLGLGALALLRKRTA